MSRKKFNGSLSAKGYYIALALCAVAIGISGFLYFRNTDEADQAVAAEDNPPVIQSDEQTVKPTDAGEEETLSSREEPVVSQKRQTVFPVEGETVAVYAMDSLHYNQTTRDWRVHNGIDIAAQEGTSVCAAADGEVYTVYEDETMGMTVVPRHDGGYTTKYSSLHENVEVEPGQQVRAGQVIGTVGNTALMESAIGDHLHFSVSCNGEIMDPAEFLNQE